MDVLEHMWVWVWNCVDGDRDADGDHHTAGKPQQLRQPVDLPVIQRPRDGLVAVPRTTRWQGEGEVAGHEFQHGHDPGQPAGQRHAPGRRRRRHTALPAVTATRAVDQQWQQAATGTDHLRRFVTTTRTQAGLDRGIEVRPTALPSLLNPTLSLDLDLWFFSPRRAMVTTHVHATNQRQRSGRSKLFILM